MKYKYFMYYIKIYCMKYRYFICYIKRYEI